jgi:phosphatidylglycerol---prolipoprotein diacylglyceryl transferase
MHPILIDTPFFTLHILWIMIAIALIAGTYALIKISIKNNLKINFITENSGKLILISLLGARLVAIIVNSNTYFYEISVNTFLHLFYIWDKGLNFFGALIAFAIYLFYLCKKNEQDFWAWMDAIIPASILSLAIFHLGAFFDGINYGRETSLPWGVNFESPAIKYAVPIHPTQIYAFLYSTVIAIILIQISSHNKKVRNISPKGFIALVGIIAYNLMRFIEEFFRGDDIITIFDIRITQISTLIVLCVAIFYFKKRFINGKLKSKN